MGGYKYWISVSGFKLLIPQSLFSRSQLLCKLWNYIYFDDINKQRKDFWKVLSEVKSIQKSDWNYCYNIEGDASIIVLPCVTANLFDRSLLLQVPVQEKVSF